MKKIMCPCCGEIVEVDESLEKIYCPKCFKNISIEQGQKKLGTYVFKHFDLATEELNNATEYLKARKDFQSVLDIMPDNVDAAEGLVLSTLFMSTVRDSYIEESMFELIRYKDTLQLNKLTIESGISFIVKINDSLNAYLEVLEKRLMNDKHFFEEKGREIYLKVVNQIIKYKETLLNLYFTKKMPSKVKISRDKLEKEIKVLTAKSQENYPIETSQFHLLFTDVDECRIPDTVFKDIRKLYRNRNIVLIFGAVFSGILILGIVLIFAFPTRLLIGVPIASVGFIGSLAFLIARLIIQKKLT